MLVKVKVAVGVGVTVPSGVVKGVGVFVLDLVTPGVLDLVKVGVEVAVVEEVELG